MILFFRFDGRDVKRIVTPSYALSDLIFVPAGVLAAMLYNSGNMTVFALFAGLMLLFVLSFNSIGTQRDTVQAERGPLTRLFEAGLALQGARRVDDLLERILAEIAHAVPFRRAVPGTGRSRAHGCSISASMSGSAYACRRVSKPIESGLFGWLVARAEPLLVKDWQHAPTELRARAEPTEQGHRVPARRAAGSRRHRAGTAERATHRRPACTPRRICTDATARRACRRRAGAMRARSRISRTIGGDLEERVAERTDELEKANAEKERLITMLRERSQGSSASRRRMR